MGVRFGGGMDCAWSGNNYGLLICIQQRSKLCKPNSCGVDTPANHDTTIHNPQLGQQPLIPHPQTERACAFLGLSCPCLAKM